jgi:hypothetical protein
LRSSTPHQPARLHERPAVQGRSQQRATVPPITGNERCSRIAVTVYSGPWLPHQIWDCPCDSSDLLPQDRLRICSSCPRPHSSRSILLSVLPSRSFVCPSGIPWRDHLHQYMDAAATAYATGCTKRKFTSQLLHQAPEALTSVNLRTSRRDILFCAAIGMGACRI